MTRVGWIRTAKLTQLAWITMASYGLQLGRSNTWWRANEVYFPKDPTSHANHIRLARNSQFPPDCFCPQESIRDLMQPCSGHCFSSIFSESRAPRGPPLVTHSLHKAPTATTLDEFCLDQVSLRYLPLNARAGSVGRLLVFGTPRYWRLSLKPSFTSSNSVLVLLFLRVLRLLAGRVP
jgi:hypothetical protein